jgi:hypothetical protein
MQGKMSMVTCDATKKIKICESMQTKENCLKRMYERVKGK